MKFRFRLQKMLHFEEMKEAIKKAEVARTIDDIRRLEETKAGVEKSMRQVLADKLAGPEWVPYQVDKVKQDLRSIDLITQDVRNMREKLEYLQFELGKLSMRRKALENLKDTRKKEFTLFESRKEQKRLDEVYRLNEKKEK